MPFVRRATGRRTSLGTPFIPTLPEGTESGAVTARAERPACGLDRTSRAPWRCLTRSLPRGRPSARLAQAAMAKKDTVVIALCEELGITTQTLYRYVSPAGALRADGKKVLRT